MDDRAGALVPAVRHGSTSMRSGPDLLTDVLCAGLLGSLGSALAAAAAARAAGLAALQPLNATSHWLHGQRAGRYRGIDASHTGVGVLTQIASSTFWAVPFAVWLRRHPDRTAREIIAGGAGTAAIAAAVDYLTMPRRINPGVGARPRPQRRRRDFCRSGARPSRRRAAGPRAALTDLLHRAALRRLVAAPAEQARAVAHEPAGDLVGADLDHQRGVERERLALLARPAILAARRAPG